MTFFRSSGGGVISTTTIFNNQQSSGVSMTFNIPANTLSADGDMLKIRWWGQNFASSVGNKLLSLAAATEFTENGPGGTNTGFFFEHTIVRESATASRLLGIGGDAGILRGTGHNFSSANWASINALVATVTGGGTAGILRGMIVELVKAP